MSKLGQTNAKSEMSITVIRDVFFQERDWILSIIIISRLTLLSAAIAELESTRAAMPPTVIIFPNRDRTCRLDFSGEIGLMSSIELTPLTSF